MSRRRSQKRERVPNARRVTVKCYGTSRPHSAQRVATVLYRPSTESVPQRIVVEYGNLGEPDSPTGHYRAVGPVGHFTRRFHCKECGNDLPLTDDKLSWVLDRWERSVLSLADARAILNEE